MLLQAQQNELERAIRGVQRHLAAAHSTHAALQRRRVALSTRLADAATLLAAARAPAATPSGASRSSPSNAETATGAAGGPPLVSLAATADRRPPADTPAPAPAPSDGSSRTVVARECQRSLHADRITVPPEICKFQHCAAISYRDLRAVAGDTADLIDFTEHSFTTLKETALSRKAALLGVAAGCDSICWFAQMQYHAAPDRPLSASATLSSPECLASFAVVFLLTRLELALITAAADHAACSVTPVTASSDDGPADGSVHLHPSDQPDEASAAWGCPHTPDRAAKAVRRGDPSAESSAEGSEFRGWASRWSGQLRCGAHDTHDGHAALHRVVQDLLQRFAGLLPMAQLRGLLATYASLLRDSVNSAGGSSAGDGASDCASARMGGCGSGRFMARAVSAALGATAVLQEQLSAAVSGMHGMRDRVRRRCRGCPCRRRP